MGGATVCALLSTWGRLAAEPSKSNQAELKAEAEWYGWQTLLVDSAGLLSGVLVADIAEFTPGTRPSTVALVGGVWYGVGGVGAPAVHWAHRQTGLGVASLGMRALVPPLVGSVGALGNCLGDEFGDGCASTGFVGGTFVGIGAAAIVDAAALAYERVKPEAKEQQRWYGWQTLSVDGASIVAGVVLAASPPGGTPAHPAVAIWVPGYLVGLIGGPVVHFAHGNVGKGFGSLGLRGLVGPLGVLPGLMGYCAAAGGEKGCERAGALWGLTGGLAVVSAFDALVLAYDPVEVDEAVGVRANVFVGPGSLTLAGYW